MQSQSATVNSSSSKIRRRKRAATASMICLSLAASAGISTSPVVVVAAFQVAHHNPRPRIRQLPSALHSSSLSSLSVPNIAVSLDKPLLTDGGTLIPYEKTSRFFGGNGAGSVLTQWLSSVLTRKSTVRVAALALVGVLLFTLFMKTWAGAAASNSLRTLFGIANGHVQRFMQEREITLARNNKKNLSPHAADAANASSASSTTQGVPLMFDANDNDGFGVCTLLGKKPLGKTSFMQYDFALPRPNDLLSLDLGQSLELCCLDENDKVVNGYYYVYQPQTSSSPPLGTFSLLVPNAPISTTSSKRKSSDAAAAAAESELAFARVLNHEIKVGDEIAMRPGPCQLDYRGQYLPVTDMVYVCFGTSGIVPVLEQVRAVLPSGSTSIKSVTVVWMSETTNDFDVNADLLEQEYFKYSSKMAASCIVEDVAKLSSLAESAEFSSSVPNFEPGTMAVLSGPAALVKRAKEYLLRERKYPADTICVL